MAGFCPNEGETFIAKYVIKKDSTDRGTGLELGLFTTLSSDDETVTYSSLVKVTTNISGGATKTLAEADWTVTNDNATHAEQTFTATGTINDVRGYYIATTGTSPRLLVVERDGNGPYTLNTNDTYKITPSITIA